MHKKYPQLFDAKQKYLTPRSLSSLVVDLHIDVPAAKAILRELHDEIHEVDLHHTQSIVEELSSITELIIIFASQPIFYNLPNEKMGVGSIDNIEMLFAAELSLDPLRLLQGLSRNRTIVASWPGHFDGQTLTYADPGHREFRKYVASQVAIVSTASAHSADLAAREETR